MDFNWFVENWPKFDWALMSDLTSAILTKSSVRNGCNFK